MTEFSDGLKRARDELYRRIGHEPWFVEIELHRRPEPLDDPFRVLASWVHNPEKIIVWVDRTKEPEKVDPETVITNIGEFQVWYRSR